MLLRNFLQTLPCSNLQPSKHAAARVSQHEHLGLHTLPSKQHLENRADPGQKPSETGLPCLCSAFFATIDRIASYSSTWLVQKFR